MKYVSDLKLSVGRYYYKVKYVVEITNYNLTDLRVVTHHSIRSKSFIGISPVLNTESGNIANTIEYEDDIIVEKDLNLVFSNYKNIEFTVDQYNYRTIKGSVLKNDILEIRLSLKGKITSYAEDLKMVDPILRYYRKMLPCDKYYVYGTFKNSIVSLGHVSKITYDTTLDKYKMYTGNGLMLQYDGLPLVNPELIDITGTEYTNPPSAVWILDQNNIDDIIWLTQIMVHKITMDNVKLGTFTDYINMIQTKTINIARISISIRSIEKILNLDFEANPYLDVNEYLSYISADIIKTFPIPYRELYRQIDDEKFSLTDLIITTIDSNGVYDDVTISGYYVSDSKISN